MGAVMMRWSNLFLAVLAGLTVTTLLLATILARNVAVSERSEARTQTTFENGSRATLDFGVADLRGSLPP